MLDPHSPPRRLTSRVTAPTDLWATWSYREHDRCSRVTNLSLGGFLIEAASAIPVGARFLVSCETTEGQIVGEATVRHQRSGKSLGLEFTRMSDEDRLRLVAIMARVRFSRLVHEQILDHHNR